MLNVYIPYICLDVKNVAQKLNMIEKMLIIVTEGH